MFTVFGVAHSFGEFFGPMADEFGTDRSETALFFALTTFAYFALGIVTGRIADRHGPRRVVAFGATAMTIGLLLTAEVESLQVGYLTYGLGVGFGVACCYVPMVAKVGGWFEARRTLALGLVVAGIGTGTLVMVPLVEWVIDNQGWRDAYRLLAIMTAVLLTVAAIGGHRPPPRRRHLYRSERRFGVAWTSDSLCLVDSDLDHLVHHLRLPRRLHRHGRRHRFGFGAVAARIGITGLYQLSFLVLSLSVLLRIVADTSYSPLILFAVVLGVAYGGFIALSPAVVAMRFGVVGMGGVLGALYTAAGVGGLVGPPTIGAIIDASGHTAAQITALASGLLGTALLLTMRPPPTPA